MKYQLLDGMSDWQIIFRWLDVTVSVTIYMQCLTLVGTLSLLRCHCSYSLILVGTHLGRLLPLHSHNKVDTA